MKNLFLTLSLVFLSVISYCQIPVNGLVAYYPFTNGSLSNVAGAYSNATNPDSSDNILTTDMIGDTNDAYHFDGSSYFTVTSELNIQNLTSYSYTGWFKLDTIYQNSEIFGYAGWYSDVLFISTDSTLTFSTTTTSSDLKSSSKIKTNVWYFFTILCEKTDTYLYLNDTLESYRTASVLFCNKPNGYFGSQLNGSITQFMVYNRLLDSTEIANIYNTFDTLMLHAPQIISTVATIDTGATYTINPTLLAKCLSTNDTVFRFYDTTGTVVHTGLSYTTPKLYGTTKYFITSYDSASDKQSTPVSLTIDVVAGTITSLCEYNSELISIYPNPAADKLYINTTQAAEVEILNSLGKAVMFALINSTTHGLDISSLANGMYFLKVKGENTYTVKKFVKE